MSHLPEQIAAGEFKAKCLELMDKVHETHTSIVITKRGIPVARLVPVEEEPVTLFGAQRDSITVKGHIIAPIGEAWDADK